MAELTKLASVKKIANGDFSEVSRILKKVSEYSWHFYIQRMLTRSDPLGYPVEVLSFHHFSFCATYFDIVSTLFYGYFSHFH